LSDLSEIWYDVIVFFSPLGVKSLFDNYPTFVQGDKKIGAFGKATAQAVIDAGLRLDIEAPTPECPSITAALDKLLSENS
jgi:uroporphyrinogen-III synthase